MEDTVVLPESNETGRVIDVRPRIREGERHYSAGPVRREPRADPNLITDPDKVRDTLLRLMLVPQEYQPVLVVTTQGQGGTHCSQEVQVDFNRSRQDQHGAILVKTRLYYADGKGPSFRVTKSKRKRHTPVIYGLRLRFQDRRHPRLEETPGTPEFERHNQWLESVRRYEERIRNSQPEETPEQPRRTAAA